MSGKILNYFFYTVTGESQDFFRVQPEKVATFSEWSLKKSNVGLTDGAEGFCVDFFGWHRYKFPFRVSQSR